MNEQIDMSHCWLENDSHSSGINNSKILFGLQLAEVCKRSLCRGAGRQNIRQIYFFIRCTNQLVKEIWRL